MQTGFRAFVLVAERVKSIGVEHVQGDSGLGFSRLLGKNAHVHTHTHTHTLTHSRSHTHSHTHSPIHSHAPTHSLSLSLSLSLSVCFHSLSLTTSE